MAVGSERTIPIRRAPFCFKGQPIIWAILFVVVYLGLMRLDYTYFWDDEAEVGIIAKTLQNTGKLTAWDGRNLFGYHSGTLVDKDLRPINPPLEYCMAAASFKMFGVSTWSGRLPFALLGLAALFVFAVMLRQETKESSSLWIYSAALLGLSVTFLLHIRQCRYYSPTLFFAVLTFYFYRHARFRGSAFAFVGLAASAALFFYSHYLICACFLIALAVTHLLFWRGNMDREDWVRFAFAGVLFLVATVPYALHFRVWQRPDLPTSHFALGHKLQLLLWTFRDANAINALPWMLALAAIVILIVQRREHLTRTVTLPWFVLGLVFLTVLGLFSEVTEGSDEAPIRYFLPTLPFLAVGIAGVIEALHRKSRLAALAVCAGVLSTNAFSFVPTASFRWLLPAFVGEVHRPYLTPYRAASDFITKELPQDATVFCFPDFCTYPLMFYTGDHVHFSNLLDTRAEMVKKHFSPGVMDRLPDRLFFDGAPDYLIAFGQQPDTVNLLRAFSEPHFESGREVRSHYQGIRRLDVLWYDTSRPELTRHTFGPEKKFNPETDAIYIFKRVLDP